MSGFKSVFKKWWAVTHFINYGVRNEHKLAPKIYYWRNKKQKTHMLILAAWIVCIILILEIFLVSFILKDINIFNFSL
ncbi:unnamed protein product [Blepharisma stoltei]|uniref:Uncharacterized protein n=1 Tax=Blepharisma stoltei TaxID=1481888 RepID=A0AAU9JHL9_9CILI|nr:unnamed protein product [Blepharisma stoltei]